MLWKYAPSDVMVGIKPVGGFCGASGRGLQMGGRRWRSPLLRSALARRRKDLYLFILSHGGAGYLPRRGQLEIVPEQTDRLAHPSTTIVEEQQQRVVAPSADGTSIRVGYDRTDIDSLEIGCRFLPCRLSPPEADRPRRRQHCEHVSRYHRLDDPPQAGLDGAAERIPAWPGRRAAEDLRLSRRTRPDLALGSRSRPRW